MPDSNERAGGHAETRRVIHDLRQPLAAMQMWLDLLDDALRGQVGDKEQRYLAKVRAEMARMAQLLSSTSGAAATPASGASGDAPGTGVRVGGGLTTAAESSAAGSLRGAALLIVEDDEMTAEALQLALEGEGATVARATTLTDGLAAFEATAPAAVLSDLRLADGDGFALVKEIRARDGASGRCTVVLAVTGFDSDETRAAARAAGFDALIVKPFALDDLVALLCGSLAARP